MKRTNEGWGRAARAAITVAAVVGAAGCESLVEIDNPGVILPEDLTAAGASALPTIVNGMVGTYQDAADNIIRYAALITDEMIMSETFPTRLQVDERKILVDNATLTGEMYAPLHQARMQADTTVVQLQAMLTNGTFADVVGDVREGIALGKLYGGYSRIWLAELYCHSILTGMSTERAPVLPDARMRQALTFLQDAESRAAQAGADDVRLAAIVGQARANLWLRSYAQAASLAERVPRDFVYWSEYSDNAPSQYNEMYTVTWGDNEAIRWTIGDGTTRSRGNELWEHLDLFEALNLLEIEPEGKDAFASNIPVVLQKLYSRPESGVLLASGIEALLIRSEAAVRVGQTADAQQILNDLRSDYTLRTLVQQRVKPPTGANPLAPLTLSGIVRTDLKRVADERARELWLTGDRFTTSRRFRLDSGARIDLFPPVKTSQSGGDDTAFPMVQDELDNNPNLGSNNACPAGQAPGAWR